MAELLIDRQDGITLLTLNRPESRNALSSELGLLLREAVTEFKADTAQKVMIITGAGDKAFCAGADLKNMRKGDDGKGRRMLPMARSTDIAGIAACEKPTIAALNGLAVGGGLEIAISCDIRVAAEHVWFGLPEPARGFIAGVAAIMLVRMLPIGVVMDMMLAGERLSAAEAHRHGFVQEVTAPDQLLAAAFRRAEAMTRVSPSALWGTKQVIKYWRDLMSEEQLRYYEAVVHRVLLSGDMVEGLKAFSEKREANFGAGWPDPFDPRHSS